MDVPRTRASEPTTSIEGSVMHELKTLSMIVAGLVVAISNPHDTNAGNGTALNAPSESVEALFHLATARSDCLSRCSRRWRSCYDSCHARIADDDPVGLRRCNQRCDKKKTYCEDQMCDLYVDE